MSAHLYLNIQLYTQLKSPIPKERLMRKRSAMIKNWLPELNGWKSIYLILTVNKKQIQPIDRIRNQLIQLPCSLPKMVMGGVIFILVKTYRKCRMW